MPCLTCVSKFLCHYYKLRHNIISGHDDVTNDVIMCAHAACHMTFWYKSGRTQWEVGSFTQDFREIGPLEAHAGSSGGSRISHRGGRGFSEPNFADSRDAASLRNFLKQI